MKKQGLYDPRFEHDSCGLGFVVNIDGRKTHTTIKQAVTIVKNLVHRGAVGGDQKTGDGTGMMIQIPHLFFRQECKRLGFDLPKEGKYGVGMVFSPVDKKLRGTTTGIIEHHIARQGGKLLGWRDVPVEPESLGEIAKRSAPHIEQVFVVFPALDGIQLERKFFVTRKCIENEARRSGIGIEDLYIPSFSCRTIVYKGLFVAPQFEIFYPDIDEESMQSSFAIVHQRYSTNTFPSWPLAQPFRCLAHNGEINTLRGNLNRMNAREATLKSEYLKEELEKTLPVINPDLSDSGILDNVLELLMLNGRSIEHSLMMMIPEAFGQKYHISQDKRAFYEFHAAVMEPWDGPAAVAFTDGIKIGAVLDRNGLRPARYLVTKSGTVVMASEAGALDIPSEDILHKGRLGPGKMLLVNTEKKRLIGDHEIKAAISRKRQYRRWLEKNRIELRGLFQVPGPVQVEKQSLITRQRVFGYTMEEITMILSPQAENAQEPVGSMGDDTPLAVLSKKPQLLYRYFKQLFAQVTNPPIDPYRESMVMSLMSFIGKEKNLLEETPEHCHQLKLPHPILTDDDMAKLKNAEIENFRCETLSILFPAKGGAHALEDALNHLCKEAEEATDQGASILILSDRGANRENAPIPALLATSAVHHHLVKCKKRHLTGLIIETGEAREVMHFAALIGFGASAVNPYLAYETIADLKANDYLKCDLTLEASIENFITAIKKGLLKTMSKMGISTIRSYRGAQIFEAVGLSTALVDKYFPGTPSRIEGVGIETITEEILRRHHRAFHREEVGDQNMDSGGNIHLRKFSEKHLLDAEAIVTLQKAVRTGDYQMYKEYSRQINDVSKALCTLRGLFRLKKSRPIPIEEVEPVEKIVKRFVSSAMSFGSIGPEAHESIAIAMNRLGAASNSGEGGEDRGRNIPLPNGDSRRSRIRQVASARFGVDIDYLSNCDELQIKMAQGAKPGEGGQLPGRKVDEAIARVRHSTPGVMLISPPPHHDIYSIEDLAQLIFDLKNVNPMARVSVKLVAEVGVGTVAAGVAKAKADMVLISGHDGGTGASPISSVKYAGIPWEIGLAETQQTLVLNRLRSSIRIQVDGQMKTGRDVVIAALLGAEEYGFGTTALVTQGCIMMRKCHLNICPVGIATQDPELRRRFSGKPEYLINFMCFVAQEVRELMSEMGFRKMEDMIGQVDSLDINDAMGHWKTEGLDFSKILKKPELPEKESCYCTASQEHDFSLSLDPQLIKKSRKALEGREKVSIEMPIRNCNRAVGARLSSEIAHRWPARGLPDETIRCRFSGSAGQSFGAFLAPGIRFELEGDANDYLGKGLSGGKIIVYPSKGISFRPQNSIISGNVNLFGATSGEVYINGMAGERFAVRNSGAVAVVEGVGDHGCEYMTGGIVVVLGKTGINFAAGMSGGIAYILDEDQLFDTKCNLEMVDIEPLVQTQDRETLYSLIQNHVRHTGSEYARGILDDWTEMLPLFVKVMPIEYRRALERIRLKESKENELSVLTEEVY